MKPILSMFLLFSLCACASLEDRVQHQSYSGSISSLHTPKDVSDYLNRALGEEQIAEWNKMGVRGQVNSKNSPKTTTEMYDRERRFRGYLFTR